MSSVHFLAAHPLLNLGWHVFVLNSLISDFCHVHVVGAVRESWVLGVLPEVVDWGEWVTLYRLLTFCVPPVPPGYLGCPLQHHDGELGERDL